MIAKKKILSFFMAFVIMLGIASPSFANAEEEVGSINLTLNAEDVVKKKNTEIEGATFELWKVADVEYDKEKDYAKFDLVEEFKNTKIELENMNASESMKAAKKFSEVAKKSVAKGITDKKGVVKFTNLKPGMYLLKQIKSEGVAKDFTSVEPFLVSVPTYTDGSWQLDVNAKPKTDIKNTKKPKDDKTKRGGDVQTSDDSKREILTWLGIGIVSAAIIGFLYYARKKKLEQK